MGIFNYSVKARRVRHPGKSLIVINDSGLRKESSVESVRILAKIDRLEAAIEVFRNHDQLNFRSWYELTFRKQMLLIDESMGKYQDLARLQNWTIAESRMKEISMPQAYGVVRDEATAYAQGNDVIRQSINEVRQARERFMAEEIAREMSDSLDNDAPEADFDSPLGQKRTELDDENLKHLAGLSDKHLRKFLNDRDRAIEVLSNVLELASNPRELELFLKIWSATPNRIRIEFSKEFAKVTGRSLKLMLDEIRLLLAEEELFEEGEEEPEAEFINSHSPHAPKILSPADELQIKIVYRKLIRFLHPDLQDPMNGKQKPWLQSVWDRTQRAYQQKRLGELNKLLILTLIRLNLLDRLTIYEIRQSAIWLMEELAHLEEATEENKRIPAWGFSRKKNTETLRKKIQRELDADLKRTQDLVSDLTEQHTLLDFLSRTEPGKYRSRRKPKKTRRKSSIHATQQESLF